MRTRTSFQKRQKEIARQEKQRDKAAKRLQRKLGEKSPEEESDLMAAGAAASEASATDAPLELPPLAEGQ
jgi:hypothetical protein